MRRTRRCWIWIIGVAGLVCLATPHVGSAEAPASHAANVRDLDVYTLTLGDVYGAEQRLSQHAGRWVILSISSRTTAADAEAWGPKVREILGGRSDEVVRFRVVDLSDVRRLFHGIARRRLRKAWNEGHTLLNDWDGVFAKAFGVDPRTFHLIVIDAEGAVRGVFTGPPTREALSRLAEVFS